MKKVYIIRHAKSSWRDMSLDDYERPLNKRGKRNAPLMGRVLSSKGVEPDLIISSPAFRAKSTAEIIAEEINYTNKILFREEVYEAAANTLHKILLNIDEEVSTLFIIGHNPGLNSLAYRYLNFSQNIPTCGIVEIEFDCKSWKHIDSKSARLISFEYPKRYDD